MNLFFHGKQLSNTLYYFRWSGKVSFDLEKCPAVLENFPDNKIFSVLKNSFQTHLIILDSLEKFHLI